MNRKCILLLLVLPVPAYAHDLAWLAGLSLGALAAHLLLSIPLFMQPRKWLPIGLYFSSVVAAWLVVIFTDRIERFYFLGVPILVLVGLFAFGTQKRRASDPTTR
jgi:hypothetical protein